MYLLFASYFKFIIDILLLLDGIQWYSNFRIEFLCLGYLYIRIAYSYKNCDPTPAEIIFPSMKLDKRRRETPM